MKENLRFVCRILVIHVVTCLLCGIVFSALFRYDELYQQENIKFFMRAVGGSSSVLGPLFQALRGLLFGLILLLLKDSILPQKYGWLKLWIIIAGIGIINAPGPLFHRRADLHPASSGISLKGRTRNPDPDTAFLIFCRGSLKSEVSGLHEIQNPIDFRRFGGRDVLSLRNDTGLPPSSGYDGRNDR